MHKQVRTDALSYLEEIDFDLAVLAWPCAPSSIMQVPNQKPDQLREVLLSLSKHITSYMFVEQVAFRQYVRRRASVGENPASSHAWKEPPTEASFNRLGNSETSTHIVCIANVDLIVDS
jgi:hypothetical protein